MTRVFTVIVFILVFVSCGHAQPIERIRDPDLVRLFGGLTMIADERYDNLGFRAFVSREDGECDGNPETCPKLSLYLVVSTIDDAPDRAIYKLPASHNWHIKETSEIDAIGEYQRFLLISMTRTVASVSPKDGWWVKLDYSVKVSPWNAQVVAEMVTD